MAVATAVLAVATFATVVFWPRSAGDDRAAPLTFRTIVEAGRLEFGEGANPVFTYVDGDRLYTAATVGHDLEVVAADVATGGPRWRKLIRGEEGRRWASVFAAADTVIVVADEIGAATERPLIVLDADTGEERWRRGIYGNDRVFVRRDGFALADAEHARLLGLDPADGQVAWQVAYPEGRYSSAAAIVPVLTERDLAGASTLDGSPRERSDPRVVMVGADRSARVITLVNGRVEWERKNVAGQRDLMLAYENQLFVAAEENGYRVLGYDLEDQGAQPSTLYIAEDTERSPASALYPCGSQRVCLLDRAHDEESTELVVIDAGGSAGWRSQPVPGAQRLLPAGDLVVVHSWDLSVTAYDLDRNEVFRNAGVAVRLNAGNLLVFGVEPAPYRQDVSLVGFAVASGKLVGLHTAPDVRGDGCSWTTAELICPTRDATVIWRFTDE